MRSPPLQLAPLANILVDAAAWAAAHSMTGYAAHRLPLSKLQSDSWILRQRPIERSGRVYTALRVRQWKDALPEAGALFAGGLSKRRLPSRDEGGLARFAAETRRAELAHWWAMACGPLFIFWNPPAVAIVMITYGVAVNAPFIAIQRYNRQRVDRILDRSSSSTSARRA